MVLHINNVWFFPNSHLLINSFYESYSFLCSHDCVYHSSSSRRSPLSIFCSAGLVAINSLCLWLSWKVFIYHSNVKNNFAGYSNVDWHLLSFRIWNTLFHTLLVIIFSTERYAFVLIGLPLHVNLHCSIAAFNILCCILLVVGTKQFDNLYPHDFRPGPHTK